MKRDDERKNILELDGHKLDKTLCFEGDLEVKNPASSKEEARLFKKWRWMKSWSFKVRGVEVKIQAIKDQVLKFFNPVDKHE
ncbi:hypothetical protein [Bartonella krasnovii]|uniref:hypothetical protein n=1 Tax=Bartonella krasnovii TaxID=2267275 RepID=UPI001F4C6DE6|nr:hypothetical protein [Bartonella krasnovii]UNF36785.1 hypothetical protein MNL11_06795 [Bartonella krasnovii]UNF38476.1 hypothetical protein MNL10_06995 [Bartonella krasnovii]UNF46713.1 hypothetical protein MNL05_06510 [Bartonella krasnovii]UNF50013.1 hypothetical protein MNL03_06945 [Bartonella krasnovii]